MEKRNKYSVNKLVAIAFIENKDNLPEVNHKDENKQNNRVDNLEWITFKGNANHGTRNKRMVEAHKENKVYEKISNIMKEKYSKKVKCVETGIVYGSIKEAGRQLQIPDGSISNVCNGKLKQTHNLHFEFVNKIE